jgi:hypothetical protein
LHRRSANERSSNSQKQLRGSVHRFPLWIWRRPERQRALRARCNATFQLAGAYPQFGGLVQLRLL